MKVVHLSTLANGNSAAVVAYRLHKGLLRLGHDSTMFVAESRSEVNDPTVKFFNPPADLVSRVRRRLRRLQITRSFARYRTFRPAGYEGFTDDRSPHGADLLAQLPPCDVINIHVMFRFVDYCTFFTAVPRHTPVVRTLHDMNFFTGGCHYDAGCGKYTERCGACPQLGSRKERDLSRQIWQRKHAALSTVELRRLHIVAPSRWLADEAKRSTLLRNFPITVIPNGTDTGVFRPRDRSTAREVLGVPQDASVVLFVAQPITRPTKGFALLAQGLNELRGPTNLLLLSAGSGMPPGMVHIPHIHLGHIGSTRLLSLVYSAADIFVIPSLQEAHGQTVLEAMACGIPVVGFAVGGIRDTIRPGVNGLLAPAEDVTALRAAICELLQDPARRWAMAANCRRIVVDEYSLEVQTQRYIKLYEAILAG